MSAEFKRNQYLILAAIGLGVFYMWTQYRPKTPEETAEEQAEIDKTAERMLLKTIHDIEHNVNILEETPGRPSKKDHDFTINLPRYRTDLRVVMQKWKVIQARQHPDVKSEDVTYGIMETLMKRISDLLQKEGPRTATAIGHTTSIQQQGVATLTENTRIINNQPADGFRSGFVQLGGNQTRTVLGEHPATTLALEPSAQKVLKDAAENAALKQAFDEASPNQLPTPMELDAATSADAPSLPKGKDDKPSTTTREKPPNFNSAPVSGRNMQEQLSDTMNVSGMLPKGPSNNGPPLPNTADPSPPPVRVFPPAPADNQKSDRIPSIADKPPGKTTVPPVERLPADAISRSQPDTSVVDLTQPQPDTSGETGALVSFVADQHAQITSQIAAVHTQLTALGASEFVAPRPKKRKSVPVGVPALEAASRSPSVETSPSRELVKRPRTTVDLTQRRNPLQLYNATCERIVQRWLKLIGSEGAIKRTFARPGGVPKRSDAAVRRINSYTRAEYEKVYNLWKAFEATRDKETNKPKGNLNALQAAAAAYDHPAWLRDLGIVDMEVNELTFVKLHNLWVAPRDQEPQGGVGAQEPIQISKIPTTAAGIHQYWLLYKLKLVDLNLIKGRKRLQKKQPPRPEATTEPQPAKRAKNV